MHQYLVLVLGPKHNDGPGVGEALEVCPHGCVHAFSQDVAGVLGEL